jgi:predicted O-methyltransferase YrrM
MTDKKNVVFWPAIIHDVNAEKYGGYGYFEYTRKSWEYWCKRNDCIFVPFTKPVEQDLFKFRPNWQKIIFLFDELDRLDIQYDQICLADSTCMIRWDAPNFFELTKRRFTGWRDTDNMRWIYDSIKGYKDFFDGFEFDQSKYINSGFIIFNEKHRKLIEGLKKLYLDNIDAFINLQDKIVKKGTEQTPFNYWLQINNVDVNTDLPIAFKLTHMHRKELFHHNWQEGDDKTPFFIKYGYNWIFNGIPKDQRTDIIKQTWDLIKDKYNMESAIYDNVLDEVLHKDVAKYTTSRKFKMDLLQIFKNDKYQDKTIVEVGASQGQSTRLLSYIFKKVIAIEWDDWNLEQAHKNNKDRDNVEFVKMDLYNDKWEDYLPEDVDVVFIDAGHQYYQVKSDIENSIRLFGKDIVIIFDDYGLPSPHGDIKKAVNELIASNKLKFSRFIGEHPEDLIHASGTKFDDMEGCICNVE